MRNSIQQASNIIDAFEVVNDSLLSSPVLLIDDIVNSRWTFTVCGALLKKAGVEKVFPVALTATGGGGDYD